MSSRRDDGLSIAVWENSPWRAFIRQRDPVDAESPAGNGSQQFRSGQDISQLLYQNNTDDVREIFGRALDAARSKKAFVSAAQIRKDVMRSEARLMAEDNRSWSFGRSKWSRSGDASPYGLDDDFLDDDDDEGSTTAAEKAENSPQQTEILPASPVVRNGSIRIAVPSPRLRCTATGSCTAAEDAEGQHGSTPEWAASAPRTPTRMHMLSPPGGGSISDPNSQLVCVTRSPQGAQPGSPINPFVDTGSRSGRARAVALGGGGVGGSGSTMSSKLLRVQAASMPARRSLEMNGSRKVISPTGPNIPGSLRRSNSFDEVQRDGEMATTMARSGSPAAAVAAHERSQGNPRMLRNHRAATSTGSVPVVASSCGSFYYRTSGCGSSSGGGSVEPHASLQRDVTLMRSRSRRAGLPDDRRASGSDGGSYSGGTKHATLVPSASSRLMDVHGARPLHATPHLAKAALSVATSAAATAAVAGLVAPLASGSYCQLVQTPSGDVRKYPGSPVLAAPESGRNLGGHSVGGLGPLPGEGGRSTPGEGTRSILGRLRGLITPP